MENGLRHKLNISHTVSIIKFNRSHCLYTGVCSPAPSPLGTFQECLRVLDCILDGALSDTELLYVYLYSVKATSPSPDLCCTSVVQNVRAHHCFTNTLLFLLISPGCSQNPLQTWGLCPFLLILHLEFKRLSHARRISVRCLTRFQESFPEV
jgi:hypothetical protein